MGVPVWHIELKGFPAAESGGVSRTTYRSEGLPRCKHSEQWGFPYGLSTFLSIYRLRDSMCRPYRSARYVPAHSICAPRKIFASKKPRLSPAAFFDVCLLAGNYHYLRAYVSEQSRNVFIVDLSVLVEVVQVIILVICAGNVSEQKNNVLVVHVSVVV